MQWIYLQLQNLVIILDRIFVSKVMVLMLRIFFCDAKKRSSHTTASSKRQFLDAKPKYLKQLENVDRVVKYKIALIKAIDQADAILSPQTKIFKGFKNQSFINNSLKIIFLAYLSKKYLNIFFCLFCNQQENFFFNQLYSLRYRGGKKNSKKYNNFQFFLQFIFTFFQNPNNLSYIMTQLKFNHLSLPLKSLINQLPETQFPTPNSPSKYYKVKQKFSDESNTIIKIGIQLLSFTQFQEDFVFYLVNNLIWECPFIKTYLIEPNYIYFEMNMISNQQKLQRQELLTQIKIINLLKFGKKLLHLFVDKFLSQEFLLGQSFNEDSLIQKFAKDVIQPFQKEYTKEFSNKID